MEGNSDASYEGFRALSETLSETSQSGGSEQKVHDLNVVLADLRSPNILVRKNKENSRDCDVILPSLNNSGSFDILFVDFDWSGFVGEPWPEVAKNPEIPWPDGSSPGMPLQVEQLTSAYAVPFGTRLKVV